MSKMKIFWRLALIVALVAGLVLAVLTLPAPALANGAAVAYADEIDPSDIDAPDEGVENGADGTEEGEPSDESEPADNAFQAVIDGFLARLKAKYGDDYETYYNAIIAEWGSVEEYLLSLVEDETDVAATGWKNFVSWLGENAPIWASALAIGLVIVLILCGRGVVNKLWDWLNSKKKTAVAAVNALYVAQIAQGKALMKLLGENPRNEEERAAIEAAIKKLEEEDDDV